VSHPGDHCRIGKVLYARARAFSGGEVKRSLTLKELADGLKTGAIVWDPRSAWILQKLEEKKATPQEPFVGAVLHYEGRTWAVRSVGNGRVLLED